MLPSMLTVLSPAKALDFDSSAPDLAVTPPRLGEEAQALLPVLSALTPAGLKSLMGISEDLAALNVERFREFEAGIAPSRAAAFAFDGPAYRALDARSLTAADLGWAEHALRFLSGLYGVLRPLDAIEPHRLEMGTRLATERGKDLYAWWGPRIAEMLAQDLEASPGQQVVVNLASREYWEAVQQGPLHAPVVSPRFEDQDRLGNYRVISFHAKRARGLMARWIVKERVDRADALAGFSAEGYRHVPERSAEDQPVFARPRDWKERG